MTTTPNYSFTIAEGTDTVNLLTQSYPNFTSLDSILKAIEETGITTSVATKVGTVFNIVRTNTDLAVMRFVATANYAAGDTFTVDGVSVTATAMNGTALPAGAFVINQSVEAILNGAVLTIVGVAGDANISASDVSYDNTVSGLTATDVQDAIDEIAPALTAAGTTYDNTVSGLTATDTQAAIDELASASGFSGYTLVASGTAGNTHAQQLTDLQTAYSGLTTAEKLGAILKVGQGICKIEHFNNGGFNRTTAESNKVIVRNYNIMTATAYENQCESGSWTWTNLTSTAQTNAIELYKLA